MRFERVTLTNFRGIESATVEFGPHLNVVFGPNDLGKSTLAEAIRAALLLPNTSTEGENYAPWHKGVTPTVELVFVDAAGHFWRITKGFRSGANVESTLAHSKDGRSFTIDARGREVDQELRKKLGWGVATPGGRSGTRGMPRSFIAKALLSEQTEVGHILDASLEEDTDESGKLRLKKALSALAEDPEVRRVLDAAQKERDRYFTATGRQKGGRASPFTPLQEELKARRAEKDDLEAEWRAAETAQSELLEIEARIQAKANERDGKAAELEDLKALVATSQAHAEARRAFEAAQARLNELVELERAVGDLRSRVAGAEDALKTAEDAAKKGEEETQQARRAKETAEQALRAVESESGTNEAMLEKARAEQQIAALEREIDQLRARKQKAEEALQTRSALETIREEVARLDAEIAGAVEKEESAKAAATAATGDIDRLASWKLFALVEALESTVSKKRDALEVAGRVRADVERLEAVVAETSAAIKALRAPDREAFKTVSTLHQERELLRGRTSAGLEVAIERLTQLQVTTTADDADPVAHDDAAGSLEVEAERAVSIALPGVATIRVATGSKEDREQLRQLDARWSTDGAPILERAGVSTVSELEAAVEEAERLKRALDDAVRDKTGKLEEIARHEAAAAGIDETERELERKQAETAGTERDELAAQLRERHPGIDLASLDENALRTTLRGLEVAHQQLREQLVALRGKAEQARKEQTALEARVQNDEAEAGKPPAKVLEEVEARVKDVDAQLEQLRTRVRELDGAAEKAAVEARERVAQAAQQLADAEEKTRSASGSRDTALSTLSELRGALTNEEARLVQVDRDALATAVQSAEAALKAAPAPERAVTDDDVAAAQMEVDAIARDVASLERERENQRGALRQTGGLVVRERLLDAERAVERAQDDLKSAELDAEAAKLLLETLKEAQQSSSAHVGAQLAKPVEERFRTLTNGRYDKLTINPQLSTGGISVAGIVRGAADLSVGTREQLATILRLVIAEHLGAPIVLDDHLVQTDRTRLGWFSDVLRTTAIKTQVIIMTCRHDDYLAEADWPSPGQAIVDRVGGALRAIDLEQLVKRWRPENAAPAVAGAD